MIRNEFKKFNRRKFINSAAILSGGMITPFSVIGSPELPLVKNLSGSKSRNCTTENLLTDISSIPNFCTHEHWGSISSVGRAPSQGGFRCDTTAGAQPLHPTSIWDLLLDPYEQSWMAAQRRDPNAFAKEAGQTSFVQWWKNSPQNALKKFHSLINSSLMTGVFQCIRRGIFHLYGIDISNFDLRGRRSEFALKLLHSKSLAPATKLLAQYRDLCGGNAIRIILP